MLANFIVVSHARSHPPEASGDGGACSTLACIIESSAAMHESAWPEATIACMLACLTAVNYFAFDRTRQGVLLALLCAVVAPAAEVVLNRAFGLWHYPRADLNGEIVSWYELISSGLRSAPCMNASSRLRLLRPKYAVRRC